MYCKYCGKEITEANANSDWYSREIEHGKVCSDWYCRHLSVCAEIERYCTSCGTHLKTPAGCWFDDAGGIITPGPYCPNDGCKKDAP